MMKIGIGLEEGHEGAKKVLHFISSKTLATLCFDFTSVRLGQ